MYFESLFFFFYFLNPFKTSMNLIILFVNINMFTKAVMQSPQDALTGPTCIRGIRVSKLIGSLVVGVVACEWSLLAAGGVGGRWSVASAKCVTRFCVCTGRSARRSGDLTRAAGNTTNHAC